MLILSCIENSRIYLVNNKKVFYRDASLSMHDSCFPVSDCLLGQNDYAPNHSNRMTTAGWIGTITLAFPQCSTDYAGFGNFVACLGVSKTSHHIAWLIPRSAQAAFSALWAIKGGSAANEHFACTSAMWLLQCHPKPCHWLLPRC